MSEENENNILIIVASRLVRGECLTRLHGLCDLEQRVVSTRNVRDAIEHAESALNREVSKIVRGHDMLTKKMHDAESEVARLNEQVRALAAEVQGCRRFVAEHLGPESEIEFNGLTTERADAILREVRAQGAIDARNALVVADDGDDIYAVVTDVAARIRAGEVQP